MPAATEAPPAPSAPAAPSPAPAAAPASPAPSKAAPISVTAEAVDKGPQAPPPRKGSARDQMFQDLRKKAGVEEEAPSKPANAETEETTEEATHEQAAATEQTATTPQTAAEKKKVSPWKLMEEHKAARLKAEAEIAELRKTMADPVKVKEIETKATAAEKRAQELEDEIRYVNYSKSKEFADKYQKPYEESWQKWMGELGELQIQDPATGEGRPLQPTDLLDLVNAPLQKAREMAEAQFGSFANDVMNARKEIKGLFDSQQKALTEAKKNGAERQTQMQKQFREHQESLSKEITEHWTKANQEAISDEKYGKIFQPVEGDVEGNQRLSKGYELADRAFSVNPLDPRLTPQQRADTVRLHAAVRNRAAAFGRLSFQNSQLEAKVKSLMEEIGKYRDSDAGGGERRPEQTAGHTSAKDDVFGALRKLAR